MAASTSQYGVAQVTDMGLANINSVMQILVQAEVLLAASPKLLWVSRPAPECALWRKA
jgi:hypothetical protein